MEMLPSGLPERVHDDEDLARFLMSSRHLSGTIVKLQAFLPNPKDGVTSVFRHGGEPRGRLWQIGQAIIPPGRHIHGAAIVNALKVRAASLDVAGEEPPPRHANIIGWYSASDEMKKAEQLEQAAAIAQYAELIRRDPS